MNPGEALLIMWITFTGMAVLGVTAVLVWAVRAHQFANQDRARYLPLMSGIPMEHGGRSRAAPSAVTGESDVSA